MGYPSRLNQSTSLPHSQEGGRQHHASPHYRSWDGSSGVGQMCVTSLGYRRITRNYMGCYQKIENPTSVSLSYSNSSMLFRSCANQKPLTALKPDRRRNEVFIMLLTGLLGDFLLKGISGRRVTSLPKSLRGNKDPAFKLPQAMCSKPTFCQGQDGQ